MSRLTRLLSIIVGSTQMILGVLFAVLSYIVYVDQGMQEIIAVTQKETPLYMFLLLFFGLFLILSGLLMLSRDNPEAPEVLH